MAALLASITLCGLATAVPALATTTAPLSVATTYLPPGSANTSYSAQLAATGGTKPYSWSISDGALPAGLTLHAATGAITGKPTVTGTASFTVEVTDSETAPATASATESITVTAPPLTVTTASLPTATADASYKATLAATGGVAPYTWLLSAGALPEGLTLHTNGTLSGTPKVTGTFSFTAEAADSDSPTETATASLSITVAAAPLVITTGTTLPTARADTAYSVKLAADGGITPYTWSVESGDLPYGVTLKKTGTISGTPTGTGTYSVTVQVADSEAPPVTVSQVLTLAVASPLAITTTSLPDGTIGANYSATLTEAGGIAPDTWSLASGPLPPGLTLNPSGTITGTVGGAPGSFTFIAELTDSENPAATATETLTLNVVAPPLVITTTSLPDGTIGASYSATLTATGGVAPDTWSLASGPLPPGLTLNPSGTITGTVGGPPDSYLVTLAAADSENPAATATETLTLNTVAAPLAITTSATLADATEGETYSATLTATGGVGPYTWSDVSGFLPEGLTLNPSTGVISGTEEEGPGPYVATIEVSDSQNPAATAEQSFTVNVLPSPVPIILIRGPLTAQAGTSYSQTLLATGGDAPYTWSVVSGTLPAGLSVGSSTGVISGTPQEPGTYTFTIQAADSGTPPATGDLAYTMTVTPASPLTITTTALPAAVAGTSYSATLTATGGVAPYTWSLASGPLPPGLALNSLGTITGTAGGSPESYTFTLAAADSENPAATATQTYTINVAAPPLAITTTALPDANEGEGYSATLTAAGGVGPYSWSLVGESVPEAFSLDTGTGAFSIDFLTATSTYTFTMEVSDNENPQATAQHTFTINVIPSPVPIIMTQGPLTGVAGIAYSHTLTAIGGVTPYTWSLASGSSLPPGLSLDSATGVISGTPQEPGTYTFTVQAANSGDPAGTGDMAFAFTVSAGSVIVNTGLPNGTIGQAYSATVAAAGGVPPYTWSLASGSSMPPGLTLNPDGTVTGTLGGPVNSYFVTLEAADSENPAATGDETVILNAVAAPVSVTTTGLPTAVAGTSYSATLAATGGVPPYTWSLDSGSSLPAGLDITPDGTISGTVTGSPGSYTFTIDATDSENPAQDGSATFTMTVASQITFPESASVPDGSVGDSYSATLSADGGLPPYTWSLASGSTLPAGLTLDPSGVISGTVGGPAGFYTFKVEVTDATPQTVPETLTMTVESSITFGPGSLPDGFAGESYSAALTADGGIAPYTWSLASGQLPPGLTVDPGGSVSGTVGDAPGSYTFTVGVTDAAGQTEGETLTIDVAPAVNVITTSLPDADAGPTGYNAELIAAGGAGSYSWTLASGSSLPTGLSLGSSTGVISGDPEEVGTFTFTIQVADSENPADTASQTFTLVVVPAPDISSGLPTAQDDTDYSGTLTVAGGVGPYTWAVVSPSSLPSGLTLDPSTGVVSGFVAVAAGTYFFEVSVTDSEGAKASELVELTVQSIL